MRPNSVQLALDFFRRLLAVGRTAQTDAVGVPSRSAQERESFEILLDELVRRAPDDLQELFQDTVHRSRRRPASGVELLDAIDEAHVGLGVAIGRGETGEDARYEQLGRLREWLYEELGRPQR